MTDEHLPADAQEAEEQDQAQAANDDRPGGDDDTSQDVLSVEAARKLRSENKSLRDRLKALDDDRKQQQQQGLSEQERLSVEHQDTLKRVQTLEDSNRDLRVRLAARNLGITDDVAAAKLIDPSDVDDWDDDRAVTRALRDLAKRHPALLGGMGDADAGARSAGSHVPADDMNALLRRAAGRVPA